MVEKTLGKIPAPRNSLTSSDLLPAVLCLPIQMNDDICLHSSLRFLLIVFATA